MSELVLTTEGETHIVVKRKATGMARGMEASYARLERLSGWKAAS